MDSVNKFQVLGKSKVIKGSILAPENSGLRFVISVNNLSGKPDGNPLLPTFDKKWKQVRVDSKGFYANRTGTYKLGSVAGITAVQSDTWVMHCLVQDETLKVDLNAVKSCLDKICKDAKYEKATVHVSDMLVDLIPELTTLVKTHLLEKGVSVYFYQEA